MLCRAFLLLSTIFLAMDGAMAQFTFGDVIKNFVTVTGTTYFDLTFYHDVGQGNYLTEYYRFDGNECGALITTTFNGLTSVVGDSTVAPAAGDPNAGSCGVNGGNACAKKTLYRYELQKLSDIIDADTPPVKVTNGDDPPKTTVQFCVRRILNDSSNSVQAGFKTAKVKLEWTTDSNFDDATATLEEDADVDVDIGDVSVKAALCSSNGIDDLSNYVYEQGEQIQICIWAELADAFDADVSVFIVEVNSFRFFTDAGVTQSGVTNTEEVGTTQILPTNVEGAAGTGICNLDFSNGPEYIEDGQPGRDKEGCVLQTFLGAPFFRPVETEVKFEGTVTIEFSTGRRRSLALKNGDKFAKTFASVVTTVSRAAEDDSCECGGFFFFFCIIMCFISSIIG